MQIVQFIGDDLLKRKVVTEISQEAYTQLVNDITTNLQSQFASDYDKKMQQLSEDQGSLGERLTHAQQALECFVWNNATATKQASMATPMLDNLIIARGLGETKQQLVDAILTKVTEFSESSANVLAEKIANDSNIIIPQPIYSEKIVKLIVDVDSTQFDDVNQVTDEALNQVVMPAGGNLDLSTISWLNAVGVKSINGQATSPQQIIDSDSTHTANLTFNVDNPIVTGEVIADGSPVTVDMVVYVA